MLLTITTTHRPATDLGYLLHKNPARTQSFELPFGAAHVFYPQADDDRCTAALLLDVDPIGMVRGQGHVRTTGLLGQYVNDRPYVASSFLSVAISRVLGSALGGRCEERPELVGTAIPLEACIAVLPSRGGPALLADLFEPLGYEMQAERVGLDETFADWGESAYYKVTLKKTATLAEMLSHLYVLVPVLDNYKHYFIGPPEMDKLLAKGAGWLETHPQREVITRRYLKYQPSLARQALAKLEAEDDRVASLESSDDDERGEPDVERKIKLNDQRIGTVLAALRACGATSVIDLGCGEGRLLRELLKEKKLSRIVGMDVSVRALEVAADRLRLERMSPRQRERIELMHGSLLYRDKRMEGFDAAAVLEVVEHFDPPRLRAFERVVFEFARPPVVVLTTPNREYNVLWENMADDPGKLRHGDHRFEWTRSEFETWAAAIARRFGYRVRFLPIGPQDPTHGPPTQMGVFEQGATGE